MLAFVNVSRPQAREETKLKEENATLTKTRNETCARQKNNCAANDARYAGSARQ